MICRPLRTLLRGGAEMAVSTIQKPIRFETKVVRYIVENIQIPNNDIKDGSRALSGTTGFTPLGVIGWNVYGGLGTWLNVNKLRVVDNTLEWGMRNLHATDTSNATLVAEVLFIKDS